MSSIIAPCNDIDPLIFSFSTLIRFTLLIISFLVISFFISFTLSSIEGEETYSFFVIWFSLVVGSTMGASKKVAQKTKTIVESIIAKSTFFVSIVYFSFFFSFGTGSNPSLPPNILIGWHLKILFIPKNEPLKEP